MASFRPCPDCAKRGTISPIVPRRITEDTAVWKCNDPSCLYPMSQSVEFFKSQFVPVSSIDERLFRRYVNYDVRSESCCSDTASVGGGDVCAGDPLSPPVGSDAVSTGAASSPLQLPDKFEACDEQCFAPSMGLGVAAMRHTVDRVVHQDDFVTSTAPTANQNIAATAAPSCVPSAEVDDSEEPLTVNIGVETLFADEQSFYKNGGHAADDLTHSSCILPQNSNAAVTPPRGVMAQSIRLAAPLGPPKAATPQRIAPPFSVARLPIDPFSGDDPTARRKRQNADVTPSLASASHSSTAGRPAAKRRPRESSSTIVTGATGDLRLSQRQRPLPQSALALLKNWRKDNKKDATAVSTSYATPVPSSDGSTLTSGKVFLRSKLAKSLVTPTPGVIPQQDASNFASFQSSNINARPSSGSNRISPTSSGSGYLPPGQSFPAYASSWRGPTCGTNNSFSDDGSDKQSTASSQSKNIGSSLFSSAVKKTLKSNIVGQFAADSNKSPSNVSPLTQGALLVQATPPTSVHANPPVSSSLPGTNHNSSDAGLIFSTNQQQLTQFVLEPPTSNLNFSGLAPIYGFGANYDNPGMQNSQNHIFGGSNIFSPLEDIFGFSEGSNDDNQPSLFGDSSAICFLNPSPDNQSIVYEELGRMNF